jgi:hypothetical protein
MAIEIGSKGLTEINIVIPQGTTLDFDVDHKDADGRAVDHTGSTVKMAFQTKSGETVDLSEYCTGTDKGVNVSVPANVTLELPQGKLLWDMIVTTVGGASIRLAYGHVEVVDTYALDIEESEEPEEPQDPQEPQEPEGTDG